MPELKNINTLLASNNFPTFTKNIFSGGFLLYKESGKIFNTIEIFGLNSISNSDSSNSSLRVVSTAISTGYNYKLSEKISIIPSLSLNVFQAALKTFTTSTSNVDYTTYISTIKQQSEINGLGVGISPNVMVLVTPFEKWKPFHFGLKMGYNFTTNLDWKVDNDYKVNSVPKFEPLGVNISFLVGLKF